MPKITINRRVDLPKEQQKQLAVIFAKDPYKPLNLSTVSNYLNETRYPYPRAKAIRDYAVEHLGGIWVTEEVIKR